MSSELEFKECDTCSPKPGMPRLCEGCCHNRHAIFELQKRVDSLEEVLDVYEKQYLT